MKFAPFDRYVSLGDRRTVEAEGFSVTARIMFDEDTHPEDTMDSSVPEDAAAIAAWEDDQWFYCGVVLAVSKNGVVLDNYAAGLWGIDCNFPNSDNSYLSEVADNLLPQAIATAKKVLARLCE